MALDLLILSRFNDNAVLAEGMEAKLLLDYLGSMQGTFLLSTYTKAEDYRVRLTKLLDQNSESPLNGFSKKYHQAVLFGTKKFGKDLFNDNDFLLKSAIAVAGVGDKQLDQALLDQYKERVKSDDNLEPLANLAMDGARPLSERIMGLHQKSDEESAAGLLRDLLLLRADISGDDSTAIRQVHAESLLQRRKFQDALVILEQLPIDKDGDKILFQRLWCLTVTGDNQRVAELQAQLDKEFPSSPWREEASRLSRLAENAENNLTRYAEALLAIVSTAKRDFDELEASLSFTQPKTGKNFTAYIAYAQGSNLFEFQFSETANLVLAYKATATDTTIFIKDEPKLLRYTQSGQVFSPNIGITRLTDNSFNFNAGFNFHQLGQQTGNPSLDSPYLNDAEKTKELIRYSARKGMLLNDITESPEGKTFSLIWPKVLKPEINEVRVVVSKDNRLLSFRTSSFQLHDVRYGPANSVKFTPPSWPSLQVVTEEKFNPSILYKLFGKVMEIFANPK